MQRRHHYEAAFEHHLRAQRVPYVAVNEARKALLPGGGSLSLGNGWDGPVEGTRALKSFDCVLYRDAGNLLVELKGRRLDGGGPDGLVAPSRLQSWVTREDVESLLLWEELFGRGFRASFVFVYWCEALPPEPLFEEVFQFRGRWYALRAIPVAAYAEVMRTRSPSWDTVHLSSAVFDRLSGPLCEDGVRE